MSQSPIGFLGLGVMGEPMAFNLARAGHRVLAWTRSPRGFDRLISAGVAIEPHARAVMAGAETIILMLANEHAIDEVLERGTPQFGTNVSGRTIVHMGTTSENYSPNWTPISGAVVAFMWKRRFRAPADRRKQAAWLRCWQARRGR